MGKFLPSYICLLVKHVFKHVLTKGIQQRFQNLTISSLSSCVYLSLPFFFCATTATTATSATGYATTATTTNNTIYCYPGNTNTIYYYPGNTDKRQNVSNQYGYSQAMKRVASKYGILHR